MDGRLVFISPAREEFPLPDAAARAPELERLERLAAQADGGGERSSWSWAQDSWERSWPLWWPTP